MTRFLSLLVLPSLALAQAPPRPADPDANAPAASPAQNRQPKQLPPPGVAIPEKDRAELTAGTAELGKEIAALKAAKLAPVQEALLPDVEIFHKAVDWALRYNEFYNVKEVATAQALLKEGKSRAAALREGKAPWTTRTGPVARGYRSIIDGSVQPYGVVVPPTWKGAGDQTPRATWIWNHGRSENLTELAFIAGAMKNKGEFAPDDTFVIHPYGRYCNATKFAGEIDVFEALVAAGRNYPLDKHRTVNAGFSMGGASAWHLGVHHSDMWAVSHAGAGFAETAEYAGVFAAGKTPPPWWEQTLWRWYDATVAVGNFRNSPMLAYYGSDDKQKQATVIMKRFAEKEGVTLEEFVGPGVGHKYEPGTKKQITEKIAAIISQGLGRRSVVDSRLRPVHYVTYSPIYPDASWMKLLGQEKPWERSEISGEASSDPKRGLALEVKTSNVSRLRLLVPKRKEVTQFASWELTIDGQKLSVREGDEHVLAKTAAHWKIEAQRAYTLDEDKTIRSAESHEKIRAHLDLPGTKNTDVCGPIDHAFMSSFIFVKPTGASFDPALAAWTKRELDHAAKQWRGIFRGDAPAIDDTKVTDSAIRFYNLVLWGDPSSNAVLKKIADKLPVKWTKDGVEFGGKKYNAAHVPILIFPNPLNPQKYVVLNSGFTFNRAAASGTNSQQTPKLPDWAIVDTSVPPDDKYPGKVVDAGFFDANWKFTTERPK